MRAYKKTLACVGMLVGFAALHGWTQEANTRVAESNVSTLEEQRKYQIINVKEYEVTCFKFDNGVDCIPDYQLNTRKKYEG